MPSDFPRFPERDGAPGDGQLVWYEHASGSPAQAFGGLVERLEVIDARTFAGLALASPEGRLGQPLHPDATTVWLKGVLHVDLLGLPASDDFSSVLAEWATLRSRLFTADGYKLWLYRRASPVPLKYGYAEVKTDFLHSTWHSNVALGYTLGAFTTDRTLHFDD